jgi:hypothetical protein
MKTAKIFEFKNFELILIESIIQIYELKMSLQFLYYILESIS